MQNSTNTVFSLFLWYDFPVEHLSLHYSLFLHFSILLSLIYVLYHLFYLSSFYHFKNYNQTSVIGSQTHSERQEDLKSTNIGNYKYKVKMEEQMQSIP